MSLPFWQEFGWRPTVLSVAPEYVEFPREPLLCETIPADVPVHRVRALRHNQTRRFGLGDLGIRAFAPLLREGAKLIEAEPPDLVYFSTTVFNVMPLGRIWRSRFGVPYAVDFQDPWRGTYYDQHPELRRPRKYWFTSRMARALEPWTMRHASGITAVSPGYIATLRDRYPWLAAQQCLAIPFAATEVDLDVANSQQPLPLFQPGDGHLHGVYAGRGGRDMRTSATALLGALKRGLTDRPGLFNNVRLHFVGTDYAPPAAARASIQPIAEELGVAEFVTELPHRVGYFDALALLGAADFLVAVGSDDPQYSASKIYPYILARKPLIAVYHRQSSVCGVLRDSRAGELVEFDAESSLERLTAELYHRWTELLQRLPFEPSTNWAAVAPFTARAMTERLCAHFDALLAHSRAA